MQEQGGFCHCNASNTTISVANDSTIQSEGTGEVNLQLTTGEVTAENVFYVPDLSVHFLSVSAMVEKDLDILFHKKGCQVTNSQGDAILKA